MAETIRKGFLYLDTSMRSAAASSVAPGKELQMFEPTYGETVVLEILENVDGVPYTVRDPRDAHKLLNGDRVIWSTYYRRRQMDGAIEPKPYSPTEESAKSRKPKAGRTETKETH